MSISNTISFYTGKNADLSANKWSLGGKLNTAPISILYGTFSINAALNYSGVPKLKYLRYASFSNVNENSLL
jgi:hypothetical protein